MIVDTATVAAGRYAALARVRTVPSRLVLGGLVAASFAFRLVSAQAHVSPRLFPDEYIYFSLARSIARGSLAIRGQTAHFPALLEPVLASPLWLLGGNDVEHVYRMTQGMHALVVSLVAVPVYSLARRIGAGQWTALWCAAFSLALPGLVYASYISADAVALTFAIGAVATGVAALERPTVRGQLTFVSFAALAGLARIQYVVVPVAFLVGTFIVERGSLRRAASAFRPTLALVVLPAVGALVVGPSRVLGYYGGVTRLHVDLAATARWLATDSLLLAYSSGWVLVPIALVGLTFGLARPRSRAELAFAALSMPLIVLLFLEAAVYASNGSDRYQGRYLLALLPLVPLLFVLGVRRLDGRRARFVAAGLSLVLVVLAATVPLAPYTVLYDKQDSPMLQAVYQLEQALGYGGGSLAVAIAAGVLAAVACICALRPRLGVYPCLALAPAVLIATSIAANVYDAGRSEAARQTFGGPQLVDGRGLDDVSVLETPYSSRQQISAQLFWNTSLTRILQMRDSSVVDDFGSTPVRIDREGRILARGRVITGPLLVEEYAAFASLDGAVLVDRTINTSLWRPVGTPRLAVLTVGRYFDGWLGAVADVTVWPRAEGPRRGVLRLSFTLPKGLSETVLDLRGPGLRRAVRVRPAVTTVIDLPTAVRAPWRVHIRTRRPFLASDGRLVSVQAKVPTFTEQS